MYLASRTPLMVMVRMLNFVPLLKIIPCPGHSPGSIGLWEAATGTLFSGDAIYDGPLLEDDIDDYIKTMERLRDLPVTVVHGGHEPSFGRERMIEICDSYLSKWGASPL